jgi:hypothetical protein
MTPRRRAAALVGVLYLITHVASVGAVALYGPMLTEPDWLTGDGERQLVGALLDVVLAAAVVGTSVALYPLLRPHAPRGAIAYVGLRTAEAAVILGGAAAVIAAVSLASDGEGALADTLVTLYEAAFLVGPGLMVPIHTVVLALVLRRTRLVAAFIPWLGLVGGPLVGVSNLAVMFGLQDQVAGTTFAGAIVVFAWEISFAVYLVARGLREPAAALESQRELSTTPWGGSTP